MRKFSSPVGVAVSCSYFFGMVGAAIVLVLAWRADNVSYVSTLRPLLPEFGWSDIAAPLEFTLGFAADDPTACDSVRLFPAVPADTARIVASAFRFATASTEANNANPETRQPVLCGVHLQWRTLAPASGSGLLLNTTLQLPPSAQSIAWSAAGLLTPSAASVALDAAAAVEVGTLEPPLDSLGMRGGRIRVSVMPLLEEDKVAPLTSAGLLVVAVAASLDQRDTAEILPGDGTSAVSIELVAEPVQQLLHVSVTQRSSPSQLLASIVGFLSGLGVVFRLAFAAAYSWAQKRFRGQPPWEREALAAHREAEAGAGAHPQALAAKGDFDYSSDAVTRVMSAGDRRTNRRQGPARTAPQAAAAPSAATSPVAPQGVGSGSSTIGSPSAAYSITNPMASTSYRGAGPQRDRADRAAAKPVAVVE